MRFVVFYLMNIFSNVEVFNNNFVTIVKLNKFYKVLKNRFFS